MDTISILLIDTSDTVKKLLEKRLSGADSIKVIVTMIRTEVASRILQDNQEKWDIILFGERTSSARIKNLTKIIRANGVTVPILLITKMSEARVPAQLQKIGVDDMLNIAEIDSPLISWTFTSTLRQAEIRKKAQEFDVIRNRMQNVTASLAFISHEINNPLNVIRLAIYQLENPEISKQRRELFFKLLVDNIGRVDAQMKALYEVRLQLGEDTTILSKILSAKQIREFAGY